METSRHQGVEAHGQGQTLPEGWWGADVCWQLLHEEGVTRTLSPQAVSRIERCHDYLLGRASGGDTLYGINTGFGDLATTRVNDLVGLQRNLLISHACGVGDPLPAQVVKAMLLLKVKSLSQGHSGVAVSTVQRLLDHWNAGVLPGFPARDRWGVRDLARLRTSCR